MGLHDNRKVHAGVLKGRQILEQLGNYQSLRGTCCMELHIVGAAASEDQQFYAGSNTACGKISWAPTPTYQLPAALLGSVQAYDVPLHPVQYVALSTASVRRCAGRCRPYIW